MKKGWQKPKLVVLTRARAEESVLQACKAPGIEQDPQIIQVGAECLENLVSCEPCSSIGTS